ncbi:hypothetical protein QE152_g8591 [Popillia japonica]|uniref:Uncharacterized protein n=1 Tax=Popillia japonica TaxID=7064 RepID=A0AAW1M3V5_POPJA
MRKSLAAQTKRTSDCGNPHALFMRPRLGVMWESISYAAFDRRLLAISRDGGFFPGADVSITTAIVAGHFDGRNIYWGDLAENSVNSMKMGNYRRITASFVQNLIYIFVQSVLVRAVLVEICSKQ